MIIGIAKKCTSCEIEKPLTGFGVDRQKSDGLACQCIECRRISGRLGMRKFVKQNKEHHLAYQRAWYAKNKEAIKAQRAARTTPEQMREYQNQWLRANPEKRSARKARRRALEAGAIGSHTADDIKTLKLLQRNRCAVCRVALKRYHLDHVVALAAGGANDKTNLQLLCPSCNLSKQDRNPIEFMQSRGYLL